jgi:hypothetical protein
MNLHQQYLYCSKMYSYITAYITHLHCDHTECRVYVWLEQLPDDGLAIEHDSIPFPVIQEPHRDLFVHPSDDDYSDTKANSQNACINPEQLAFRTSRNGTPYFDTCLAVKPISMKYFEIFNNDRDLWSPLLGEREYWLAYWCDMHNLSSAAINEYIRNPTMATVRNFTSSQTIFKRLHEMSYVMGLECLKSGKVHYTRSADLNNHCDEA